MKVIQRDVLDDFGAYRMANLMEKCGVSVFTITTNPWKVWGKGTDKGIELFLKTELDEAREEERENL